MPLNFLGLYVIEILYQRRSLQRLAQNLVIVKAFSAVQVQRTWWSIGHAGTYQLFEWVLIFCFHTCTVLGDCAGIVVRNMLVTNDRSNHQIGFLKTNCQDLWSMLLPETPAASLSASPPPSVNAPPPSSTQSSAPLSEGM